MDGLSAYREQASGPEAYLITIVKKLKKGAKAPGVEADSASSNPQAIRTKKESLKVITKFSEKSNPVTTTSEEKIVDESDNNIFPVILIKEGMGNFGDCFFYTKEALESAAPIFEGKKIYADHPSRLDDENRPERSTRDILGYYQNVHTEILEDGRTVLAGELLVPNDPAFSWANALMKEAVKYAQKYPGKDLIGLSINASGDSEEMPIEDLIKMGLADSIVPKIQEAIGQGIQTVRMVKTIDDAVSCDLVTEAGAGGRVLNLLESTGFMEETMKTKKGKLKEDGDAAKKAPPKKDQDGADASADHDADTASSEEGDDAGHDDAAQDVELIKKMIKQHLGDKEEPTEEECGVMKQAYEAAMEMGHKEDEAQKMAASHLKIAKHMAAKQSESKEEKADESEAAMPADKAESEEKHESKDDDKDAQKENAKLRADLIKARGEIAKFKEAGRLAEVLVFTDKLCKESKLSNAITKEFKDLTKDCKTKEEVQKSWKIFESGFKSVKADAGGLFDGLIINPEKTGGATEGSAAMDFSDCTLE